VNGLSDPNKQNYNVEAKINSEHLLQAANIIVDGLKNQTTTDAALRVWMATMRVNTKDLTDTAEVFARIAAKMQWPPELIEFLASNKMDSKDFKSAALAFNPTFHVGESTQKTTLEVAEKLNAMTLALAQSLEKVSENFSKIGTSFGLNPQTATVSEKILTLLEHKLDLSNLENFKLSKIIDKDLTATAKVEVAIEPQTGFVMSGIIAGVLSSVIAGMLANKHISQKDAEFTKADGAAACVTIALVFGAWALIKYSAVLAGIA
jgi:hypothetical protein